MPKPPAAKAPAKRTVGPRGNISPKLAGDPSLSWDYMVLNSLTGPTGADRVHRTHRANRAHRAVGTDGSNRTERRHGR